MKNCLIMGFGRSGTSLMAGILNQAGYFSGDDLYPARESNPHGFFENALINGINEDILREYDYNRNSTETKIYSKTFSPFNPGEGHRWLTFVPLETEIVKCDDQVVNNIREAVKVSGFAYKDPRFNYTLKIWNKLAGNETVILCMFRQPDITVNSVIKECQFAGYLSDFYIDQDLAYRIWFNSYSHLLKNLSDIGSERIVFIHYEQLLENIVFGKLSAVLDMKIDSSFVVPYLNRSKPGGQIPADVGLLYDHMCHMAGFGS